MATAQKAKRATLCNFDITKKWRVEYLLATKTAQKHYYFARKCRNWLLFLDKKTPVYAVIFPKDDWQILVSLAAYTALS